MSTATVETTSGQRARPRRPRGLLNLVMVVSAITGLAALLLEFGFYRQPAGFSLPRLHVAECAAALLLVLDRLARGALAEDRGKYLRRHWAEPVLLILAAGAMLLPRLGLARFFGGIAPMRLVQILLALMLLTRGLGLIAFAAGSGITPSRLLVGVFGFLVLLGTGLLMLPTAVPDNTHPLFFEDAFFTAASAACLTGLSLFDVGTHFTRFGQVIVLGLIQLGGLAIMIFGTLFVLLGRRLHRREEAEELEDSAAAFRTGPIVRITLMVILGALAIEAAGAFFLLPVWADAEGGLFSAIFHSISAFCNAGFSLEKDSFLQRREQWQILSILPLLVILGGLGFPVLFDLVMRVPQKIGNMFRRREGLDTTYAKFTLQTKVVLLTTVVLLVVGTCGLMAVEPSAGVRPTQLEAQKSMDGKWEQERLTDWQQLGGSHRLAQAWFLAVSTRTGGFSTIKLDQLSSAGQLWLIFLMLIGGSPGSAAGGMKTVTFALLLTLIGSVLRNRDRVEILRRHVPDDTVRRAVTFAALYLALVAAVTLLLSIAQGANARFMDVLFESVSACGNVGLSLGETARLTLMGKYVVAGAMLAGRVGSLALLMSLIFRYRPSRYSHPTENLPLG